MVCEGKRYAFSDRKDNGMAISTKCQFFFYDEMMTTL